MVICSVEFTPPQRTDGFAELVGDTVMYLSLAIIVGVAIWLYIHVQRLNRTGNLIEHRRQVETYPSVVSTLGVLGTFIGISIGLLGFETNNLSESIPKLLSGLKTAFFTSIAGMVASIVLSKKINSLYDGATGGQDDINGAANLICQSVNALSKQISVESEKRLKFYDVVSQSIQNIVSNIGKSNECVALLEKTNAAIKELSGGLERGISEVKDRMNDTNKLLGDKFDDFAVLLQKNNTEALVEVMRKVTEEFQSQMNALISRLVAENFEQLNNSVEQLNKWQVENKEMIQSLILQYKAMVDSFEQTSIVLAHVKDDTASMVGKGGKLAQLVKSLSEVIIEDEKFKSISNDLQQTAELSKSNMENFDQSTKTLNEWVRKQRDFAESVVALIGKLNELNEIKDYAGEFWKETKTGMNEAVNIIKRGSDDLNTQLNGLDEKFYARLSTTLRNLDTCIQAIVDKNSR